VSDEIVLSPTITNTTTVVSDATSVDGARNALQRNNLSAAQALTLATNALVLQQATGAEATQIFATLDTSTLDPATQQAIIDAVQKAPDEVRAAFEANINLFGDGFNSYIPLGSQIPISTRRAMIAAGVAVAAVASGATRGRSRSR
jgi:predicted exporter